jgi:hypothetical protein
MINELLLLSGNDIPFPEGKMTIHQPTLKEIAYIGEEAFFIGCGFLDFSKKILNDQDKVNLKDYDDFDIFMSIMLNKEKEVKQTVEYATLVLALIFPLYSIDVRNDAIVFIKEDGTEGAICKKNFVIFKTIIRQMFNLNMGGDQAEEYKPAGSMAQRIAEKFKKRHETLLKLKNNNTLEKKSINILSRYVSILAVGEQKNLNELMQYTVYQLYDELQRYQLKVQWDAYIQARMAGAKDLEEVDNWMIDLKDQKKNKNKN